MVSDPARIKITFSPRREYLRKYEYIVPLEKGGGTQILHTTELRALRKNEKKLEKSLTKLHPNKT